MTTYWSGIIAPAEVLKNHEKIISKVKDGNYSGADLSFKQRLSSYAIYSVRINSDDRLLFTSVFWEGELYIFHLEVILNHDYQKSQFLNKVPNLLCLYIAKILGSLQQDPEWVIRSWRPEAILEETAPKPTHIPVYYNKQWIRFGGAQNALLDTPLPLIINGHPGSGKTLHAYLEMLRAVKEDHYVIYLTSNNLLKEEMLSNITQSPHPFPQERIFILNHFEFACRALATKIPDIHTYTEAGEAEFISWLNNYIEQQAAVMKSQGNKSKGKKGRKKAAPPQSNKALLLKKYPAAAVYQECRIISAHSATEYGGLGEQESYFKAPEERQFVQKALVHYIEKLKNEKKLDCSLCLCDLKEAFPFIAAEQAIVIGDEAQAMPLLLARRLIEWVGRNIIFLRDNQQSIKAYRSSLESLKKLFFLILNQQPHLINLSASYRICKAHYPVIQQVITLRRNLMGGIGDKGEVSLILPEEEFVREGRFQWITSFNAELIESKSVVITLPEYKEAALQVFGEKLLVLSISEVLGLEFPSVIIYRVMDHIAFKEISRLIQNSAKFEKDLSNLPKTEQSFNPEWILVLNYLFIAFSRSTEDIIFFQEELPGLKNILQYIFKLQPKKNCIDIKTHQPDIQQWRQQAKNCVLLGNSTAAQTIFMHYCGGSVEEFEAFAAEIKEQVTDSLFAMPASNTLSEKTQTIDDYTPQEIVNNFSDLQKQYKGQDLVPWLKKADAQGNALTIAIEEGNTVAEIILKIIVAFGKSEDKLLMLSKSTSFRLALHHQLALMPEMIKCIKSLGKKDQKELLNERDKEQKSILILCVEKGHAQCLKDLLKIIQSSGCLYETLVHEDSKGFNAWNYVKEGDTKIASELERYISTLKQNQQKRIKNHKRPSGALQNESDNLLLMIKQPKSNEQDIARILQLVDSEGDLEKKENNKVHLIDIAVQYNNIQVIQALLNTFKPVTCETLNLSGEIGATLLRDGINNQNIKLIDALIKAKVNVNTGFKDGLKAIHLAILKSNIEVVDLLIRAGADVNLRDKEGFIPLQFAINMGNMDIVKRLIKAQGIDINLRSTTDQNTALYLAVWKGNKEAVDLLIGAGADVNLLDKHGFTLLQTAIFWGHMDIVNSLIKAQGIEINFSTIDQSTALYLAVEKNNSAAVDLLIGAGADVNLLYKQGFTLLQLAIDKGNMDIVNSLIKAQGIEINFSTIDQSTALHLAVFKDNKEAVDLLIGAGADVNVRNKEGFTPLQTAIFWGHMDIVNSLIKAQGIEINFCTIDQSTALHLAVFKDNKEAVDLLIGAGADVNVRNKEGFTPLQTAIFWGHMDIVNSLIKAQGIEINFSTIDQSTALHLAVIKGNKEAVDLLIGAGADVNVRNKQGFTPLQIAIDNGNMDMVNRLIRALDPQLGLSNTLEQKKAPEQQDLTKSDPGTKAPQMNRRNTIFNPAETPNEEPSLNTGPRNS